MAAGWRGVTSDWRTCGCEVATSISPIAISSYAWSTRSNAVVAGSSSANTVRSMSFRRRTTFANRVLRTTVLRGSATERGPRAACIVAVDHAAHVPRSAWRESKARRRDRVLLVDDRLPGIPHDDEHVSPDLLDVRLQLLGHARADAVCHRERLADRAVRLDGDIDRRHRRHREHRPPELVLAHEEQGPDKQSQ